MASVDNATGQLTHLSTTPRSGVGTMVYDTLHGGISALKDHLLRAVGKGGQPESPESLSNEPESGAVVEALSVAYVGRLRRLVGGISEDDDQARDILAKQLGFEFYEHLESFVANVLAPMMARSSIDFELEKRRLDQWIDDALRSDQSLQEVIQNQQVEAAA